MNKNQILNSMYLVPALLEKLEGNNSLILDSVLKEFNIENVEEYRPLINLLKYHDTIIKNGFNSSDETYSILRKGLTEYFDEFLSKFWQQIGFTNLKGKILLDYGSGSGVYSDAYEKANPECKAHKVDKCLGSQYDFIKNPDWFKHNTIPFDTVLLSEILHCKDLKWQKYLIESSLEMLSSGGQIIINENVDPFMNWRLNEMTDNGQLLDQEYIINLLSPYPVKLTRLSVINYHNIFIYDKI